MTTTQKAFPFLVGAAIMLVTGIAISRGIAAALIVGGKETAWAHATCHIDDFRRAARVMEETK